MSKDVGKLMPSRSPETTQRYRGNARARQLVEIFLNVLWVSDQAAAMAVVQAMVGLAKATVKSLVAAAAQQMRDLRGPEAGQAFADLVNAARRSLGRWPKPKVLRTSAQKLTSCKSAREEKKLRKTLDRLHGDMLAEGSTPGLGTRTFAMVEVCSILGLRPIEIPTTRVQWREGITYIEIRNAKATNDRACGEWRRFHFKDSEKYLCHRLVRALKVLKNHWLQLQDLPHPWAAMYHQCRGRLYRVAKEIYKSSRKRLTLYTFRHMLASDLKARGVVQVEIGAIFGHASDATCGKHYAKAQSARGRSGIPIADPDTVAKVRQKHRPFAGAKSNGKKETPPAPPPKPKDPKGPTFG